MSEDWWTHIVVIKEKYLWSNLNQRERISFKLLKFHGQYIYHGEDLVSRFSIHLPSFDVLDSLFSGFLERYINTISGNSQGNKSSKFQFLYFFSALTSSRCNSYFVGIHSVLQYEKLHRPFIRSCLSHLVVISK